MIKITELPYDINDLRKLCRERKIVWKRHALIRLYQRNILQAEITECILNGEIIEKYISDKPHPSCLVLGYAVNGKILHVVCSTNGEFVYIITAYEPDGKKWSDDYKTRKEDEHGMY